MFKLFGKCVIIRYTEWLYMNIYEYAMVVCLQCSLEEDYNWFKGERTGSISMVNGMLKMKLKRLLLSLLAIWFIWYNMLYFLITFMIHKTHSTVSSASPHIVFILADDLVSTVLTVTWLRRMTEGAVMMTPCPAS